MTTKPSVATETVACPLCLRAGELTRAEVLDRIGVQDFARVAQLSAEKAFRLLQAQYRQDGEALGARFKCELARRLGETEQPHAAKVQALETLIAHPHQSFAVFPREVCGILSLGWSLRPAKPGRALLIRLFHRCQNPRCVTSAQFEINWAITGVRLTTQIYIVRFTICIRRRKEKTQHKDLPSRAPVIAIQNLIPRILVDIFFGTDQQSTSRFRATLPCFWVAYYQL
jgi:hypothetical protein